jgi:hypothetical protein
MRERIDGNFDQTDSCRWQKQVNELFSSKCSHLIIEIIYEINENPTMPKEPLFNPYKMPSNSGNIFGFPQPSSKKNVSTTTPPLSASISHDIQHCVSFKCEYPKCTHPSQRVHHIKPRKESGKHTYSNLIALCGTHHNNADDGILPRADLKKMIGRRTEREESCIRSVLDRLKK